MNGKVLVPSSHVKACDFLDFVEYFLYSLIKVKDDHRSKFSNLSNWKEEA